MQEFKDKALLARHEAAHAVVALRLGRKLENVTIVPDDSSDGKMKRFVKSWEAYDDIEWEASTISMLRMIDGVMISIAGQVCEDIINDIPYKDAPISSQWDNENIADWVMLNGMDQSEIDLFLRWMHERTRLLLLKYWSWVEAIANALLERQTLSGDEVWEICQKTDLVE
jgi:ATP-dependent Zn protease